MDANPLLQKYGRAFEPGELIFEEDEVGDLMFIIQEGQVQISRTISGRDTPMALLDKGEFFGEMAIVNRIRRTARARAASRTQLLAFDRVGLEQLVEKNPKIALSIIDRLCRRLGAANAHIRQLSQASGDRGLWGAVRVLAQREGPLGSQHLLQDELALTLDLPQDEVSRFIGALVSQGALSLEGEVLHVRDRELLQRLAEAK